MHVIPVAIALLLTVAAGCGAVDRDSGHDTAAGDAFVQGANVIGELVDSLATIEGKFRQVNLQWQFDGDDSMFRRIAGHGDSALAILVECLDRAEPAAATVNGRRVLVGVMCYTVLQRTAYPTEHEDGSGEWAGVVFPTASAGELEAAKAAWQEVLATGRYRLP